MTHSKVFKENWRKYVEKKKRKWEYYTEGTGKDF